MIDISKIKERINCVEYAQRNGIPIRHSGDRCVSPIRPGATNKTSFWVFDNHFFDFGSGIGGDVIDLAATLHHGGDKGKAIRELAELTGVTATENNSAEWMTFTKELNGEIQYYHEHLTAQDREYLYKRHITDDTINRLKIGRTKNNRLCFPYWKNGYICYYATRHLDYDPNSAYPDRKYMKASLKEYPLCEHTVWGLHSIEANADRELLVIAEGAFDAMSFEQEGYSVISAITGFFSRDQLPTALSIAKMFKKVFLVYDNDIRTKAGEKFTIKMTKILTENRIPCIVGAVPAMYKDISEYYADGGNLATVIADAQDSVEFLASKITDPKEFEIFAKKSCRYMSKTAVEAFFQKCSNSFPAEWLKTLCKECKSAPVDDDIAKEIISKHKLLYHPNISFFEYNGKYWERKTDYAIERYISEALGSYTTGPKLSSILRVIKSHTETAQLFNAGPVMNFINGTMEFTEEEPFYVFREQREGDYCTYCLPYPYIPDKRSKEWTKTIDTITDSDEKRKCFLQEFAGYVLFPDNRLHKCAALVGNGSNGKSIYFNTLKSVFGEENVSSVEFSKFSNDFHTIGLLGKMLNISGETKDNIQGTEDVFKKVVCGETIRACYKGKDLVDFNPRSKMIVSLNNFPKTSDYSDGLSRRFAFVNFPLKFVEEPKDPNERLIDKSLEFVFRSNEQLSAIFNWVLDGYLILRRCGYLTEPDDHKESLEEFKAESDPTITFVQELHIVDKLTYAQVYQKYHIWCEDNGYKAEGSRSVLRRIVRHVKTYRRDLQPAVSNSVRYLISTVSTD